MNTDACVRCGDPLVALDIRAYDDPVVAALGRMCDACYRQEQSLNEEDVA